MALFQKNIRNLRLPAHKNGFVSQKRSPTAWAVSPTQIVRMGLLPIYAISPANRPQSISALSAAGSAVLLMLGLRRLRCLLQRFLNFADQCVRSERLDDVVINPRFNRFDNARLFRLGRAHYDRRLFIRFPHLLQHGVRLRLRGWASEPVLETGGEYRFVLGYHLDRRIEIPPVLFEAVTWWGLALTGQASLH